MSDRAAGQLGLALIALGILGDLALFATLAVVHRQAWVGAVYLGCALAFLGLAGWLAYELEREPEAERSTAAE